MNPDTPLDKFALATYAVVFSIILQRVGNRHDAEDLVQEAFLSAIASPDFDPARPDAIGFVLQPASWRAGGHFRRRARAPKSLPFGLADRRAGDPGLALEQQEECDEARRRLADAVDALGRDKELFLG